MPTFVYGVIRDIFGNVQVGAIVQAKGNSSESYGSDTTDADGKYIINLQNYASDGDTITVIASYESYTKQNTYTLTLGDLPEQVNLQFSVDVATTTLLTKKAGKRFIINYKPGRRITVC